MKQKNTIVIIRHHHGDLDDVASVHLATRGFTIDHRYPFEQHGPDYGLDDACAGGDLSGAIIMGGAQNVTELDKLPYLQREVDWVKACIVADIPLIGICLGAQLVAHALGGTVSRHSEGLCEFGYEPVYPASKESNSWLVEPRYMVQAHFQGFTLPPGCTGIATGARFPHQAFHFRERVFGFQFHPEVSHSMFSEWQNAEWADDFYNTVGAQEKGQASQYNTLYNTSQTEWFRNTLDRIFVVV